MNADDKDPRGAELVARLLTPQEIEAVSGSDFTTYGQSGNGYCKFDQSSGGYSQNCPKPSDPIIE